MAGALVVAAAVPAVAALRGVHADRVETYPPSSGAALSVSVEDR